MTMDRGDSILMRLTGNSSVPQPLESVLLETRVAGVVVAVVEAEEEEVPDLTRRGRTATLSKSLIPWCD
jgi:hypothetical protein